MSSPSNSLLLFYLKEQKVGARNEPPARFAPSCSEGKKKKKKKKSARRPAVMVIGSCRSLDRWTFYTVVCKTFFFLHAVYFKVGFTSAFDRLLNLPRSQ